MIEDANRPSDATVVLDPTGKIVEANREALGLFGVTLAELREAPPGSFAAEPQSPEDAERFRETWEAQGSPDIVGTSTLRRRDGTEVRVGFGITPRDDGTFLAVMRPIPGDRAAPARVFTAGDVLAQWRAAERRLDAIDPASPEWADVHAEIEWFRREYQAMYEARRDRS